VARHKFTVSEETEKARGRLVGCSNDTPLSTGAEKRGMAANTFEKRA
jgi:hypothetical protein